MIGISDGIPVIFLLFAIRAAERSITWYAARDIRPSGNSCNIFRDTAKYPTSLTFFDQASFTFF